MKKGSPSSPAMAIAKWVFPHPDGPWRSRPGREERREGDRKEKGGRRELRRKKEGEKKRKGIEKRDER